MNMVNPTQRFHAALLALGAVLLATPAANAVNSLQLDITGASYDTASQTIVAGSDRFTLYTLGTPKRNNPILGMTHYVSMALTPKTGPVHEDLGWFSYQLDGDASPTRVDVTAGMVYGDPPLEALATQLGDPGDMPDHDIFETFFREVAFEFLGDNGHRVETYDTQPDDPNGYVSAGPVFDPAGRTLARWIDIDVSNLAAGVELHFDLYNTEVVLAARNHNVAPSDVDIDDFAPFSHDAQTGGFRRVPPGSPPPGGAIPEPTTAALGMLGLLAVGGRLRRR